MHFCITTHLQVVVHPYASAICAPTQNHDFVKHWPGGAMCAHNAQRISDECGVMHDIVDNGPAAKLLLGTNSTKPLLQVLAT